MGTTPKPGDSDQHRAVSKNGKDQIQDKQLREIIEQEKRHHEEFLRFAKHDLGSHEEANKTISAAAKVAESVERKLDKYTFTGKVLWSLAGLLWTGLVAAAGWMAAEVGAMDDAIREQGAKQSRIEAQDAALKDDLRHIEQDLRDLRRLVQEHQINKREHKVPQREYE